MTIQQTYKLSLWIQAVYYFLTAIWGLADIESFMAVTGPKTDIWLVKTVSVLIFPIVVCLLCGIFLNSHPLAVILVAATATMGFAVVDFYYTANYTIKWVYAVDGVVQTLLLLVWLFLLLRWKDLME